tara:strand:+ start:60 stop:428 length:369 start_codon:yes stop_codon:yes gene_type:complete
MVRKRLQPGSTRGRVIRPPRPPKGKSRDSIIKILLAPKPSGPPRTKKRPKPKIKGLGSLVGLAAGNVLKKAPLPGKSKPKKKFGPITPKAKKGEPKFMKPIGKVPKSRVPELLKLIKKGKGK